MLVFSVHPNVSQGCQGGCATCSDYNGCLSCKPRLFFVLERIGMKQIGVCLSSCPSGYYGTRYPDINKCASKCWGKGSTWICLFSLERCVPLGVKSTEKQKRQAVSFFLQFSYSTAVNINLSKKLRWKITEQPKAQGSQLLGPSISPCKREVPLGARHCSLAARGTCSTPEQGPRDAESQWQEPFNPLPLSHLSPATRREDGRCHSWEMRFALVSL